MQAILIPVKRFGEAKLRLAKLLDPESRQLLGTAMLEDVLSATEKWTQRLIVTSDPDARAIGLGAGCAVADDEGDGLNAAVEVGTQRLQEIGVNDLVVVPSDVPLVTSDDVAALFSFDYDVVVAPSNDGGTNALRRRPPSVITASFGDNSAQRHIDAARSKDLKSLVIVLKSLELDIDGPEDLSKLARSGEDRESVRVAKQLLANRGEAVQDLAPS